MKCRRRDRTYFLREDIKEMEKSNIMIRLEKKEEQQKVENLVRESFWNVYRPGCLEHYVLHQLRNDPAFVPELDFVMVFNEKGKEDKLIGQNMFMRTSIKADDGTDGGAVQPALRSVRSSRHARRRPLSDVFRRHHAAGDERGP